MLMRRARRKTDGTEQRFLAFGAACLLLCPAASAHAEVASPGSTRLASIDARGVQAAGESDEPAVSADGRYVTFASTARHITPGDDNEGPDVFLRDLRDGSTQLLSATPAGVAGNGSSWEPSISDDGSHVVFTSTSSNLIAGDNNDDLDVFMWERATGRVSLVSIAQGGGPGNESSQNATISRDGTIVGFESLASNLVPRDTNARADIFLRALANGVTRRVSVSSSGAQGNDDAVGPPALSYGGTVVAFASLASNLVAGDSNGVGDVFVHDVATASTSRVSVSPGGVEGEGGSFGPAISAAGDHVAFFSASSRWFADDKNGAEDVFVRDMTVGTTVMASRNVLSEQGDAFSLAPSISGDGKLVAFRSWSRNLTMWDSGGNWQIYVRDLAAGWTEMVSVDELGTAGNDHSRDPRISPDGRFVVFSSLADNLTPDRNVTWDVFERDRSGACLAPVCPIPNL